MSYSKNATLSVSTSMAKSMKPYPKRNLNQYKNKVVSKYSQQYQAQSEAVQKEILMNPHLLESIFNFYQYPDNDGDDDPTASRSKYNHNLHEDVDFPFQYELELVDPKIEKKQHLAALDMFVNATRAMGEYALRWHLLMEDVLANPQLEKLFNDLQLMRRLGGSKLV